MSKNIKIIGGIVVLVIIMAVGWFVVGGRTERGQSFALDSSILPQAWEYSGVYNTPELAATVQKNIETLKKKLGADGIDAYDIHISLAQQYMLIGDGRDAYTHLLHAVEIDRGNSLSYQTIGVLMKSLGAMSAAEESFKVAVMVQPQIIQNHLALIGFYIEQGAENEKIETVFADALEKSGRAQNILIEYAQWLEGKKDIARAIAVWEEVLKNNDQGNIAVKEKIAQLKKKL